ncbi:MAG: hypothetical protein N2114_06885 [Candidatus Goldbacteria bacterium]|nr:hypothetical protein [Candidatus Goldiibacteriota bacterium]
MVGKIKKSFFIFFVFFYSTFLFADKQPAYIIGHITTCSGLINNYPADSVNWFYRSKHQVVQFFAYFLFYTKSSFDYNLKNRQYLFVNPYEYYSGIRKIDEETNFTFENIWVSPSKKVICEKILTFDKLSTDKRIGVADKQYIPYAFGNFIGINETFPENGQLGLPTEKGLYNIQLFINGELVSITFFEMKD